VGRPCPTGPDWLHDVKYDGYRLRLKRDGDRVRLIDAISGRKFKID
jgi:ATP-dependent DNA ligase